MDSKLKEKIENIENILSASFNYVKALEINDADVSNETLDYFTNDITEAFDKLQRNAVIDMCNTAENEQINEEEESCKFVSLY